MLLQDLYPKEQLIYSYLQELVTLILNFSHMVLH